MAEPQNPPSNEPPPNPEPLGNQPEARNLDGSLKTNPEPKLGTEGDPAPKKDGEPEGKKDGEGKTDPKAVPEKYEFTAPEGYTVDEKLIEEATPILKELGLTNEQGQKLIDIWNKHSIEAAEGPYKQYQTMRDGWRNEVAKSADLGDGKDNISAETQKNINKVFESIGDAKVVEKFKTALDLTGAGDHPDLVRAFNALGKVLGEGTVVRGSGPAPTGQKAPNAPTSAAQALYPNLPSSAKA